jgi:hypothetical protein
MFKYQSPMKVSDPVLFQQRMMAEGAESRVTVEDIEKEREFLRNKERIIEEFQKIDRNSNQHISLAEWLYFVEVQVQNRSQVVVSRQRIRRRQGQGPV